MSHFECLSRAEYDEAAGRERETREALRACQDVLEFALHFNELPRREVMLDAARKARSVFTQDTEPPF